ncbi:hypothetical protein AVEN_94218-1, partial [Araneus ventricosus]
MDRTPEPRTAASDADRTPEPRTAASDVDRAPEPRTAASDVDKFQVVTDSIELEMHIGDSVMDNSTEAAVNSIEVEVPRTGIDEFGSEIEIVASKVEVVEVSRMGIDEFGSSTIEIVASKVEVVEVSQTGIDEFGSSKIEIVASESRALEVRVVSERAGVHRRKQAA